MGSFWSTEKAPESPVTVPRPPPERKRPEPLIIPPIKNPFDPIGRGNRHESQSPLSSPIKLVRQASMMTYAEVTTKHGPELRQAQTMPR